MYRFLHHVAAHAGQPRVHAGVEIRQLGVVEAHQVQDRGVQVGDVAAVFDGSKPSSSVAPIAWPPLTPAPASHIEKPCQLWSRPGLPTPSLVGVRPNSPPQIEQRLVPEPGALQVGDQRGDRLVGLAGVQLVVGDAVVVAVPGVLDVAAAGIELDEAHALLEQPARDQALAAEVGRELVVRGRTARLVCVALLGRDRRPRRALVCMR